MGDTTSNHSAADSAIGYYYQCMYALLVLLDAVDHATVAIETADDIEDLQGAARNLRQLKHSEKPKPLSIKNDGFWNTIGIWSDFAGDPAVRFFFVTTADLKAGDPLKCLLETQPIRAIKQLTRTLHTEAKRVKKAREDSTESRYAARWDGCRKFLALTDAERQSVVSRIVILEGSPTARDIPAEVFRRLVNIAPPELRPLMVEPLISWWDRQCFRALNRERPRSLHKSELQRKIAALVSETSQTSLSNDFGEVKPPPDYAYDSRIKEQVDLVDGGDFRLHQAQIAYWRAVSQREKWSSRDTSMVPELQNYDDHLEEEWAYLHEALRHDCRRGRKEPVSDGLGLFDWSLRSAHDDVRPFRKYWSGSFLTAGSYQMLAVDLRVGWHPEYRKLLGGGDE